MAEQQISSSVKTKSRGIRKDSSCPLPQTTTTERELGIGTRTVTRIPLRLFLIAAIYYDRTHSLACVCYGVIWALPGLSTSSCRGCPVAFSLTGLTSTEGYRHGVTISPSKGTTEGFLLTQDGDMTAVKRSGRECY